MIQLNHPTGNANVRHVLIALSGAGELSSFWTTVVSNQTMMSVLPAPLQRKLARRDYSFLPLEKVRARPLREACRIALPFGNKAEHDPFSIDSVCLDLDRHVARNLDSARVDCVYSYEDSAKHTFERAQELGIHRIYDLPVGYWKQAYADYAEESELQPRWRPALIGLEDSSAKLERKEREIELATAVFVASSYTARTLQGQGIQSKTFVIPFGSPPTCSIEESPGSDPNGPLRVLFVGSIQQRKGISYLFEAVEALSPHVNLTLVGSVPVRFPLLESHLAKHTHHAYLPHAELLPLMRQHDVLILPSISDGFGLVILEALSQGLPVIASENTGGPDIIADGENGWIVPIRSATAIQNRLVELLPNRQSLRARREAAIRSAEQNTWQQYEARLLNAIVSSGVLKPSEEEAVDHG